MGDAMTFNLKDIMSSLSDGVYVCDLDRRITFWNESAERITGWAAGDVIGSRCFDDILCHVDKDGHRLCGEEYCPLHRAMVTGTGTRAPLLVYALGKDGRRVPMMVNVAPIRDAGGRIIGGVETFRDATAMVHDLERAKVIQGLAMRHDLPEDPRVTFATHYIPHDIVGGDYYIIDRIDDHRYGVMLADVMGHGIAAALYTMHLSQLWDRFRGLARHPAACADRMNRELFRIMRGDSSFAAAVFGLLDLEERVFRLAGAGGPEVLLAHADGTHALLSSAGRPLGVDEDAPYEEAVSPVRRGDSILLFTDGAVEVMDASHEPLGTDGLITILRAQGHPKNAVRMDTLEEELLKYSNAIRLEDDLTLIEIRVGESF